MREFYYKVNDDSMSGDRIFINDEVLIRETTDVSINDICAIANEVDISKLDLRRIEERDGKFLLTASNSEVKTEMRSSILLVGKIIMTYKNT